MRDWCMLQKKSTMQRFLMAKGSYNSAVIIVSTIILLSSCARNPAEIKPTTAEMDTFLQFVRNNGYDWYNTSISGNALHCNTADAKLADGMIVVDSVILYKDMKVGPCGPSGVTSPRQYDAITRAIDPVKNTLSLGSLMVIEGRSIYALNTHKIPRGTILMINLLMLYG